MVADFDRPQAAHVVAEQWLRPLPAPRRAARFADLNNGAGAALAGRVAELGAAITGYATKVVELSRLGPRVEIVWGAGYYDRARTTIA